MIEQFAVLIGRNVRVRGIGRLLRVIYPCGFDSPRFVNGLRMRGDGLKFDVDTRQVIDWSLLFHGEYEPHMRHLFNRMLSPGAVAVDVGANVGAHTLTLANLVGSSGHVLAFEPNPVIRVRLERNLQINGFDNVTVRDCALGDVDGRLSLRVPSETSAEAANPGLASLVALDTPHDLVEVDVCRLDDVYAQAGLQRLDLVKIDVQGFEMQVLRGMKDLINKFSPVIVFEYEGWAWSKAGSNLQAVLTFFEEMSYELCRVEGIGLFELMMIDSNIADYDHMDIVAIHRDDPRISHSSAPCSAAKHD